MVDESLPNVVHDRASWSTNRVLRPSQAFSAACTRIYSLIYSAAHPREAIPCVSHPPGPHWWPMAVVAPGRTDVPIDLLAYGEGSLPFDAPKPPVVDQNLLVARTGGSIEWMCPSCTRLHRTKPTINGRLECDHLGCKRRYLVGFALVTAIGSAFPPWNGRFDPVAKPRPCHNQTTAHLGQIGGLPLVARLSGPLEWRCSGCSAWNYQYADWTTGQVMCGCGLARYVIVVLYAPAPVKITPPQDWISYVSLAFPRRQRFGALGSRRRRLRRAELSAGGVESADQVDGGTAGRVGGIVGGYRGGQR